MSEFGAPNPAEQSVDRAEALAQLHATYDRVFSNPLEETFTGYKPLTNIDLHGYYKYDTTVYAPRGTSWSIDLTGSEYNTHVTNPTPVMRLHPLHCVSELSSIEETTGKRVVAVLDNATNTKRQQDNFGVHYRTGKTPYGTELVIEDWSDEEAVASAISLHATRMDRYYVVADDNGARDILKLPGVLRELNQDLTLQDIESGEAKMLTDRLDTFIEDYPELRKVYLEYQAAKLAWAERGMSGGEYLAYRAQKVGGSILGLLQRRRQ